MSAKYFTLAEANALLPTLRPLMANLLQRRARVTEQGKENWSLLQDVRSNIGGAVPSALVQDFMAIEALVARIRGYDCVVKDINAGLIDFLTEIDGREVYLCWRFGEPEITHYHELHTGFNGRKPVEP